MKRASRPQRVPHSTDPYTGQPLKQCYRCEAWLPLYCFWRNAAAWDKLVGWCKSCSGKPARKPYVDRRRLACEQQTKVCSRCQAVLPRSAYDAHAGYRDGLHQQCKPCRLAMKRESRAAKRMLPEVEAARLAPGRACDACGGRGYFSGVTGYTSRIKGVAQCIRCNGTGQKPRKGEGYEDDLEVHAGSR